MVRNIRELFAGISNSGKQKKKLYLAILASIVLVAVVIGVAVGVSSNSDDSSQSQINKFKATSAHSVLQTSCSSTLYPELCYSTIASVPGMSKKISNQKDVIEHALKITRQVGVQIYVKIKKIIAKHNDLTKREKAALNDCLEMVDETLDEIDEAIADLEKYTGKTDLKRQADDLKTLLSSAITNQQTCLDGFSHGGADKRIRKELLDSEIHVGKMCSNGLAMICNFTNTHTANEARLKGRNLVEHEVISSDSTVWPKWLSAGDRRLLQSSTVTPNVVVAADGSGNYKTVSAAVAAAPAKSSKRYVIRIKAGVYKENVDVPKTKTNIMFLGDGNSNTIITASLNVQDGSTTFNSATVAAVGAGFLARDITFQNTAGAAKHQAVALRVGSDLSAFYRCNILAYQDTLYVHSNRQFFVNCLIVGTVDFIFGNAAVVLQNCDLQARRPDAGQKNMFTAQGRTDPNQNTGIVIQKCRLGATSDLQPVQSSFPTYLGRPWKQYSRTVVMQSSITNVVNPAGWFPWDGNFALDTLTYREYQNTGAGAATSGRVTWKGFKVITSSTEAQGYTPGSFIAGGNWLSATGFPFTLGL